MPKTKKCAPYSRVYSVSTMKSAVDEVLQGAKIYSVAKRYGLPYSTLKDQVAKFKSGKPLKLGTMTHLSVDEEAKLVKWINTVGGPKSWGEIKAAAKAICEERHGEACKSFGILPSKKWLDGFKSRHPNLKIRQRTSVYKEDNLLG